MNGLQYGRLDEVSDILNTMPQELNDQDIKGVLINLCERIRDLEARLSASTNRTGEV